MGTLQSFEELDCYQRCRKVRIWIYELIRSKKIQDRDIVQNIKRAGRSTTRNIAEGFGRQHHKENIQFCKISVGSLHEILDDFNILTDEHYCTTGDVEAGKILVYKALKSTNGYIAYLRTCL